MDVLMTMNTTTIKVALVGHDHAIEVNPNDHDDHIMRTTIAISKAGAILIRRYARKCRVPAVGKTAPADLSRDEFYEYIRDSMPKIATFVGNPHATKTVIAHCGNDLDNVPYALELSLVRVKKTKI